MSAVKTSALDPLDFSQRFADAAHARGFRAEPFVKIGAIPLAAYTRRSPGVRPKIYVSSGIHGDEPAPPLALLRLLEAGVFDQRATWFLCPLLNPAGFLRNVRENDDGLDLNRDYQALKSKEIAAHVRWLRNQPNFDAGFCLHEDWEARGFYLYEINPDSRPSLAATMVAAAGRCGPIDASELIDGRPIDEPGIIRPQIDPQTRTDWPEALYLREAHTRLTYTVETASALPLEQRVETHISVLRAALTQLLGSEHTTSATSA